MDLTYATIPVFGGDHGRLNREVRLAYIVSDHQNLINHPIYVVDDGMGSSIFHLDDDEPEISVSQCKEQSMTSQQSKACKIYFDGSSSKEGSGAGILLISPSEEVIALSYKMEFETTNNIDEYEALVLGLRAAKDMAIDCLTVFGDYELVINQVRNIYQTKQQRLKKYMNEVWDLIDNFFLSFNISFIPREQNHKANYLALAASTFRPPIGPNIKYQVEIKHRTTILDNLKRWQVFSGDLDMHRFLYTIDEFSNISIDQEIQEDENEKLKDQKYSHLLKTVAGHDIVELKTKTNNIPKGLVPLERLFDNNDVYKGTSMKNKEEEVT
jgi:ribonuclease HI